MKKILIVINTLDIGGAETLLLSHIKYFIKKGNNVYLVTTKKYNKNFLSNEILNTLRDNNYFSLDINGYFDFGGLIELRKIIKLINPDTIISHLEFSNIITSLSTLFSKQEVIAFEHVQQIKEYSYIRKFIKKVAYQQTKVNIAVSHKIKNDLIKKLDINNCINIDNFIQDKYFKNNCDLKKINELRNNLGIEKNDFVILSIGRIEEQKNYLNLIRDIEPFIFNNENVKLLIVGEGSQKEELKKMIKSNLKSRILILNARNDLEHLIDLSNIYISYSIYEGFALTIVEAMARAKVILTTKTFGPDLYIKAQINGYFIDENSLEESLNSIYKIENESLMDSLKIEAHKTANQYTFINHIRFLERYM